jgi:hypothetical protein
MHLKIELKGNPNSISQALSDVIRHMTAANPPGFYQTEYEQAYIQGERLFSSIPDADADTDEEEADLVYTYPHVPHDPWQMHLWKEVYLAHDMKYLQPILDTVPDEHYSILRDDINELVDLYEKQLTREQAVEMTKRVLLAMLFETYPPQTPTPLQT